MGAGYMGGVIYQHELCKNQHDIASHALYTTHASKGLLHCRSRTRLLEAREYHRSLPYWVLTLQGTCSLDRRRLITTP